MYHCSKDSLYYMRRVGLPFVDLDIFQQGSPQPHDLAEYRLFIENYLHLGVRFFVIYRHGHIRPGLTYLPGSRLRQRDRWAPESCDVRAGWMVKKKDCGGVERLEKVGF